MAFVERKLRWMSEHAALGLMRLRSCELSWRLGKIELDHSFILHVVHMSGTRMIAQGTDGLSRCLFLEGVMAGRDMLLYVDLAKGAIERQPKLVDYVQTWVGQALH